MKINIFFLGLVLYSFNIIQAADTKIATDRFGNSILLDWNKFSDELASPDYPLSEIVNSALDMTKTDWKGRQTVYGVIHRTLIFKKLSPERRRELIEYLVAGVNDTNVYRNVIKYLRTYKKEDFSDKAKKMLKEYFEDTRFGYNIALLYGIVDLHNRDDEIQKLYQVALKDGHWTYEKEWASLLVMARRGEPAAVNAVVKETLNVFGYQGIKTNGIPEVIISSNKNKLNITVGTLRILDNVVYIRQPESIILLWALLNNGGSKNSAIVKYSIASLVKLIDDFPLKAVYLPDEYTEEDVTTARKWMKENGWKVVESFKKKKTCADKPNDK